MIIDHHKLANLVHDAPRAVIQEAISWAVDVAIAYERHQTEPNCFIAWSRAAIADHEARSLRSMGIDLDSVLR